MSHEIPTPMNAVIGVANIPAISKPLTQKQQEFLKKPFNPDALRGMIDKAILGKLL